MVYYCSRLSRLSEKLTDHSDSPASRLSEFHDQRTYGAIPPAEDLAQALLYIPTTQTQPYPTPTALLTKAASDRGLRPSRGKRCRPHPCGIRDWKDAVGSALSSAAW